MRFHAIFTVLALCLATSALAETLVVDTFLIGKASDKKFNCLMTALNKITDESAVDTTQEDWSKTIHEGVQQGIDINTMLLQYHYFKQVERDSIKTCELSLDRAFERCKSVYGECQDVTYNDATFSVDPTTENEVLPFVTRKCPDNYVRYGCCSCMRSCSNYPELFTLEGKDMHGYCTKKASLVSRMSDKQETDQFEPAADKFIERCEHGWVRVGTRLCVPKCPLGWHDHGDRCIKTGKINLIPFSWQPGDEE